MNRICQVCRNEVESEEHFILRCKLFDGTRNKLLEELSNSNANFMQMEDAQRFKLIMCTDEEHLANNITNTLYKWILYILTFTILE